MWQRDEFFQYRPGMHYEDFPKDKIPLFQMEHLRQLDYMITRGVSYERTAYTFLAQIELSNRLSLFKSFSNTVVLLNEEGAMIRHDNEWDLVFTPDRLEQTTLAEDADLFPVYEQIINDVKSGKKCWVRLNHVTVRSLLKNCPNLNILDNYCRNYPGGYLAVAEKIVIEGTDELYANVPVCRYGNLTTVDLDERESYDSVKGLMDDYIYAVDHAEGASLRPLSIAVFGAPGSGKSFGVKQIAKSFDRFDVYTLNLSQYISYDEMITALDIALKSAKKIPLIFFDEFDCEYMGVSRGWLKFLLAPMQDGEYTLQGKIISIEKAVFVFAGGTASSFNGFLPSTPEEARVFKAVKGPDFVSRLRGALNIKGPNPTEVTDKSYIIRRAILLRDMIKRKVPQIYNKETGIVNISQGLLSALLRTTEYRHGTRSMEFILDMSRLSGVKKFTPSCLPMQNQLDIHLDFVDLNKKLAVERIGGSAIEQYVSKTHELFRQLMARNSQNGTPMASRPDRTLEDQIMMRPWEELDEEHKEEYRIRLRLQAEGMEDIGFPLGIRPRTENMPDTVYELYGNNLEMMAKLGHEAWLQNKLENGWKYGPVEDRAIRVSPMIRSYEDLDQTEKENKQINMSKMPEFLREVGLEIYRKSF